MCIRDSFEIENENTDSGLLIGMRRMNDISSEKVLTILMYSKQEGQVPTYI